MKRAVILAGGRSSRSGRIHKALRSIRHKGERCSWLEYQIRQLRAAGYQRIVLATGFRSRQLVAQGSLTVQMHNPDPRRGPFSTLQQGIKGFTPGHTLLQPLDNPVPTPGELFKIRQALKQKQVAKPCYAGRGGHPLMLSNQLVKELKGSLSEGPEARLDKQLRKLEQDQIARVGVRSPQILSNLNTARQWQRYLRCFQRSQYSI